MTAMSNTHKNCRHCKIIKPIEDFGKCNTRGKTYVLGKCKECYKEEKREASLREIARRKQDESLQIKKRERDTKYRQSSKGKETKKAYDSKPEHKERQRQLQCLSVTNFLGRCIARAAVGGLSSDIDIAWFLDTINLQSGKCHYCDTKVVLSFFERKLDQVSIDRKDNDLGYLKSNCLITCTFCNWARNCCPYESFKMFISTLRTGVAPQALLEESTKPFDYLSTIRNNCVRADINKNLPDIITSQEVKDMMLIQQGKCAVTGLPFRNSDISHFPLKPSIDRIDSNIHHTRDNCQLVCLAINFGKNTSDDQALREYVDRLKIT